MGGSPRSRGERKIENRKIAKESEIMNGLVIRLASQRLMQVQREIELGATRSRRGPLQDAVLCPPIFGFHGRHLASALAYFTHIYVLFCTCSLNVELWGKVRIVATTEMRRWAVVFFW